MVCSACHGEDGRAAEATQRQPCRLDRGRAPAEAQPRIDDRHDFLERPLFQSPPARITDGKNIAFTIALDRGDELLTPSAAKKLECHVDSALASPVPAGRDTVRQEMGTEALEACLVVLADEVLGQSHDVAGHVVVALELLAHSIPAAGSL